MTVPEHQHPPPKPHQITGAAFLAARGFAYLADEPGAGKSAQAVMAADLVKARRILLFCPATLRANWAREFALWQTIDRPLNIVVGRPKVYKHEGVTIVSHDSLANDDAIRVLMAGYPYDLIIIDEAHVFRAMDARRTEALLLANDRRPSQVWSWAPRIWCLSGTPIVNSAADLWPWVHGPMRTPVLWYDFCLRYTDIKHTADGPKPIGVKNAMALADSLRPHFLCRTLESVGEVMPSLDIRNVDVPVPRSAMTEIMADLSGWSLDRLTRALEEQDELRSAAISRVRRVLGTAKAPLVAQHVENILVRGEGPVVVFFQHTDVRDILYTELSTKRGRVVSWIDGHVNAAQLGAAESWFQAGKLDVLLVQTQAGGVGLTLTAANRVIVAELPWTAVGLWQAIKRCHRIGQRRPVLAEVIRASGCWLEEVLASVVGRKHKASQELLSLLVSSK